MLNKKLFTTILAMAIFLILMAGCVGEGQKPDAPEGKTARAPEYEFLLDRNYWTDKFGPESQAKNLPEEQQWVMDVVNRATGVNNWEQVSLGSEKGAEGVTVNATNKYKSTGVDDDSLSALLSRVEPVKPKVLSGFTRDDMLGTFAFGNPRVAMDAFAQWLFDSKSITEALKAHPQGEQVLQGFLFFKATLKGMYMSAKEKTEPLVGEEFVFVAYVNKDFIGWDKISESETFVAGSPIRFVIGISAAKPGLADAVSSSIRDIGPMLSGLAALMGADFGGEVEKEIQDLLEIKTMKAEGYDISYLDFYGEKFGWAEKDGAMFFSDVETLKNLGNYFDAGQPAKNMPATYNTYCSIDIDKCLKSYGDAWKGYLDKWVEEVKAAEDEELTNLVEGFVNTLKTGENLGYIESVAVNGKNGIENKLRLGGGAGPLVLQMAKLMEMAMQEIQAELKGEEEPTEPKGAEESEI